MFEIIDRDGNETIIKVIGVGGAGGNAVEHMIREGVGGVEFVCCNTDAQALKHSSAGTKLQLGPGLGAGGKPERAHAHAQADREKIADLLRGAHMCFITAGMGGGTGTGAAPVIAEVARELGILTVAVVTKPFAFEGKRNKVAEEGLSELAQNVDSLIVILNEKLMEVLGEDVPMLEAFKTADNVLKNAVGGISELINVPGLVNVDFEDVRTVMGEMGKAMMGSASAAGVDRARLAAEQAVASPLLEGIELSGAKGVLVNITASSSLGLKEYQEVMNTIHTYTAADATVICGAVFDDAMEDQLRVTVVATGLGTRTKVQPKLVYGEGRGQRTGTYDTSPAAPVLPADAAGGVMNIAGSNTGSGSLDDFFTPNPRGGEARARDMSNVGLNNIDIPAFLRRQAD